MVTLRYKFKSHGKRGKWYSMEYKTYAEAKRWQKFMDKEAHTVIEYRGSITKKPNKRKSIGMGGLRMPSFNLRF